MDDTIISLEIFRIYRPQIRRRAASTASVTATQPPPMTTPAHRAPAHSATAPIRIAPSGIRACANRSWLSGRPALPAVANPALPNESPHDDDHIGERNPEADDP